MAMKDGDIEDSFDLEDVWYCPRCKREYPDDKMISVIEGAAKCPVCKKILVR